MTKQRRSVPGVHPYDGPAGGWGALKATAIAVRTQMDNLTAPATLLRTNQPDGFDCPGCAWPDKEKTRPSSSVKTAPRRSPGRPPANASRQNFWRQTP